MPQSRWAETTFVATTYNPSLILLDSVLDVCSLYFQLGQVVFKLLLALQILLQLCESVQNSVTSAST